MSYLRSEHLLSYAAAEEACQEADPRSHLPSVHSFQEIQWLVGLGRWAVIGGGWSRDRAAHLWLAGRARGWFQQDQGVFLGGRVASADTGLVTWEEVLLSITVQHDSWRNIGNCLCNTYCAVLSNTFQGRECSRLLVLEPWHQRGVTAGGLHRRLRLLLLETHRLPVWHQVWSHVALDVRGGSIDD